MSGSPDRPWPEPGPVGSTAAQMTLIGIDAAVARARSLVARRADRSTAHAIAGAAVGATSRAIIGIAGPPGAGKSTLANRVADAVPGAVVVGLDGFHLAHSVLVARGDVERKGAIDTFDAAGYVALLERIRVGEPGPIWAPEFRRDLEDAIAGASAVAADTPLVITEGNYLLVDSPPWSRLPQLCDELWYAALPEPVRIERLVARHVHYGRTHAAALARATTGSDAINARLVARTGHRAQHHIDVLGDC